MLVSCGRTANNPSYRCVVAEDLMDSLKHYDSLEDLPFAEAEYYDDAPQQIRVYKNVPNYRMITDSGKFSPYVFEDYDRDSGAYPEGLVPVKMTGKWGFVNSYRDLAIHCVYDDAGAFSE